MNIITLDFETYYSSKDYTLKKLTTEAYVRDPRFQALGVAIKDKWETNYYERPDIEEAFKRIDWQNTAVIAHHAQFDGLILSHHYGIKPAFWFDTLSMARHSIGNHLSVSLGSLAKHYGLEPKSVPYNLFDGRRFEDLDDETRRTLASGGRHDADLTFSIFQSLMGNGVDEKAFPREELYTIDMTIRMFTEPCLVGDQKHFEWIKEKEWLCKNEMMMELGVTEKELGSNERFAKLLEAEGVEVEFKEGKNGPIHAFAKTDDFMMELQDHVNPRVVELVEARQTVKSSIDETRAGRLAAMSSRGPMPVYLSAFGAQTTRWSGGDSVNWQNFSRPRTDQPDSRKGELRRGIRAPEGHLIGVVDKSQIECRLLNRVAQQWDVVERFRNGEDPYIPLASKYYGREITKADKSERGFGKQLELSCGYGAGGPSIVATARRGTYGPPITLTDAEGVAARYLYRSTHQGVVRLWGEGNHVLRLLADGATKVWRDVVEIKNGRIYLPNGSWMQYYLRWNEDERGWERKTRNGWRHIWGGVIVQNLMEGLARVDLAQGFIRLRRLGIACVGTVHDEGWFVHPRSEAEARHLACLDELERSPAWLPDLPLAVEGELGEGYTK